MEDSQLMVDHVGGSGRKTSSFTNGDNGAHPSQTIVPPMFILSRAEQVALQLFQLPAQPFQFTACLIQPVLIPLSGLFSCAKSTAFSLCRRPSAASISVSSQVNSSLASGWLRSELFRC